MSYSQYNCLCRENSAVKYQINCNAHDVLSADVLLDSDKFLHRSHEG